MRTFGASVVLVGLGQAVTELYNRPLRNLSCPGDICGVKKPAWLTEFQSPLFLPGEFGTAIGFHIREEELTAPTTYAGFSEFAKVVDFGSNRVRCRLGMPARRTAPPSFDTGPWNSKRSRGLWRWR